jgi:hypothetical protein
MIGGHNKRQEEAVPEEFKNLVHCESRVSVAVARGQFGIPGKETSSAESQ